MKYRLAVAVLVALALQMWIVHLGIMGGGSNGTSPSSSTLETPVAASTPAPYAAVVPVSPVPSINQSMRFWSDAEAHGRLDTNLALKRYFFDLAMNHRILVQAPSGAQLGIIVVPGDVANLNWNATTTQETRLTDSGVPVEITPDMLQELKRRRDRLIALGAPQ
jgi:hypothetical protein